MRYPDLMIDIETLGTAPGSVITQVAVVGFDRTSPVPPRTLFFLSPSIKQQSALGMTIDADTVAWWAKRPSGALAEQLSASQTPLDEFCECFDAIFRLDGGGSRVWAFSPNFDCVLIEALYQRLGRQIPWGHRQPRDLRTLADCAGVEKLSEIVPYPENAHRADVDAQYQACCVQALWHELRGIKP
jgi:hypothetical protein